LKDLLSHSLFGGETGMEIHINLRANKINKRGVFGDSPVEITAGRARGWVSRDGVLRKRQP